MNTEQIRRAPAEKGADREAIAAEILKVERARYQMHGEPSPECGNVACGHAVDALVRIYNLVSAKEAYPGFYGQATDQSPAGSAPQSRVVPEAAGGGR